MLLNSYDRQRLPVTAVAVMMAVPAMPVMVVMMADFNNDLRIRRRYKGRKEHRCEYRKHDLLHIPSDARTAG